MGNGIEYIDLGSSDDRVVAAKLVSRLTVEGMAAFLTRIEAIRAAGKKALVYVDATGYDGFELGTAKEKLAHMGTLWNHIERVAYVVDKTWMAKWIGFADVITPIHIRAFEPEQDAEARAWTLTGA
jgi:hypothetical protein